MSLGTRRGGRRCWSVGTGYVLLLVESDRSGTQPRPETQDTARCTLVRVGRRCVACRRRTQTHTTTTMVSSASRAPGQGSARRTGPHTHTHATDVEEEATFPHWHVRGTRRALRAPAAGAQGSQSTSPPSPSSSSTSSSRSAAAARHRTSRQPQQADNGTTQTSGAPRRRSDIHVNVQNEHDDADHVNDADDDADDDDNDDAAAPLLGTGRKLHHLAQSRKLGVSTTHRTHKQQSHLTAKSPHDTSRSLAPRAHTASPLALTTHQDSSPLGSPRSRAAHYRGRYLAATTPLVAHIPSIFDDSSVTSVADNAADQDDAPSFAILSQNEDNLISPATYGDDDGGHPRIAPTDSKQSPTLKRNAVSTPTSPAHYTGRLGDATSITVQPHIDTTSRSNALSADGRRIRIRQHLPRTSRARFRSLQRHIVKPKYVADKSTVSHFDDRLLRYADSLVPLPDSFVNTVPPVTNCSDEQFITIVDSVKKAIAQGVYPILISQGSSGSYFCRNPKGEIVGVFKPKNEEPYGNLNPKWAKWVHKNLFPCCFGRSCIIPNLGYISEAAASFIDRRLMLNIVPRTEVVKLASPTFFYGKKVWRKYMRKDIVDLPEKIGSFQLFLHGYKDATRFFRDGYQVYTPLQTTANDLATNLSVRSSSRTRTSVPHVRSLFGSATNLVGVDSNQRTNGSGSRANMPALKRSVSYSIPRSAGIGGSNVNGSNRLQQGADLRRQSSSNFVNGRLEHNRETTVASSASNSQNLRTYAGSQELPTKSNQRTVAEQGRSTSLSTGVNTVRNVVGQSSEQTGATSTVGTSVFSIMSELFNRGLFVGQQVNGTGTSNSTPASTDELLAELKHNDEFYLEFVEDKFKIFEGQGIANVGGKDRTILEVEATGDGPQIEVFEDDTLSTVKKDLLDAENTVMSLSPDIVAEALLEADDTVSDASTSRGMLAERLTWTARAQHDFRRGFERLVVLDYLIRNTDRGLDNWMAKFNSEEEQKEKSYTKRCLLAERRKLQKIRDFLIKIRPKILGRISAKFSGEDTSSDNEEAGNSLAVGSDTVSNQSTAVEGTKSTQQYEPSSIYEFAHLSRKEQMTLEYMVSSVKDTKLPRNVNFDGDGKRSIVQVAAIDNGLAFPYKHPDQWRSYPYGWGFLPAAKVDFSVETRLHVLHMLTSASWWKDTEEGLEKLFRLDADFSISMFKKQMSILRGEGYNLVETLRTFSAEPFADRSEAAELVSGYIQTLKKIEKPQRRKRKGVNATSGAVSTNVKDGGMPIGDSFPGSPFGLIHRPTVAVYEESDIEDTSVSSGKDVDSDGFESLDDESCSDYESGRDTPPSAAGSPNGASESHIGAVGHANLGDRQHRHQKETTTDDAMFDGLPPECGPLAVMSDVTSLMVGDSSFMSTSIPVERPSEHATTTISTTVVHDRGRKTSKRHTGKHHAGDVRSSAISSPSTAAAAAAAAAIAAGEGAESALNKYYVTASALATLDGDQWAEVVLCGDVRRGGRQGRRLVGRVRHRVERITRKQTCFQHW